VTFFPWRRLLRIAVAGVGCAVLVAAGGTTWQWLVLGADGGAARQRAETEVRAAFEEMAARLRQMGNAVADPAAVSAAADEDAAAARRLFTAADAAVAGGDGASTALTVYDSEGAPLAWAGRTSNLPREQLLGGDAWFFAPVRVGLRLIHTRPIDADGRRVGVVATERLLTAPGAIGDEEGPFFFETRFGPVALEVPSSAGASAGDDGAFDIAAPSGERLLTARIADEDLSRTRERWTRATRSVALIVLGMTILLLAGPVLDWRNRVRHWTDYVLALSLCAVIVVAARIVLRAASPADWSDATIFSGAEYVSPLLASSRFDFLAPLLSSPFDFLSTALAAGALSALLLYGVEAWRIDACRRRRWNVTAARAIAYGGMQVLAGILLAAIVVGHQAFVRDTTANTTLDLLHFSLRPLDTARLALQVGLVVAHATALALGVLVLRAAQVPWRIRRTDWRTRAGTITCWTLPLVAWQMARGMTFQGQLPLLTALAAAVGLAVVASRLKARYRHGSQAFRLTLLTLGLIVPAFAFYPVTVQLATDAKEQLVETRYAPQAIDQRREVVRQLEQSLPQIDEIPGLTELVAEAPAPTTESLTDSAFRVWQETELAMAFITSSVELYGPDGQLVSRFAFNLPEDLTAPEQSDETTCDWAMYAEVAPFFAEDRGVLHAGRMICPPAGGKPLGAIVVHAMVDYENLTFISSRSPYVELLRPPDEMRGEGLLGRDIEYAVYGWSRTPDYSSSDTAWLLPDDVFARVEQSRVPVWARLRRGSDDFDVYLQNDRAGVYALGFPVTSALGHLVNLAELTVLAVGTYVLLLAANAVFGALGRRGTTAPALLREIRASFYRKLFLAFVAAVFLPVVALALVTRNFVAGEIRGSIEQEAVRTAAAAGRVVEDLVGPRAFEQDVDVTDNLMVWVSRLIDQDVNFFDGPRLLATSERNLFASGLLPTRTNADIYHALKLRNEAATVVRERVATIDYLLAGTPLTVRQSDGILTVPLASRQQEIDEEIATLDRRVLLASLLFILAGAGLGYSMAERISDPVNRLTRATRRIARGDLDARIAARSSDELRRLVEDFNSMAAELQRQRRELERTHRLEAWAEMARQVAHEIKNPLTPIQLNAEHLRRVHADRGEPLSPVLQECVATILTQVTLLRQIASDFSNFASSPTAKLAPVDVPELLREVVEPYRRALADRIQFEVHVPARLPMVYADRTLVARSLTNLVENALHAMPRAGTLGVSAAAEDRVVRIRVSDTGAGMDTEALARAFEPYFSTKASGTGLGLPIAKRNVELSGGTVSVTSEREKGTTVEVTLPVQAAATTIA
jgi:signal transduction histidine kinase